MLSAAELPALVIVDVISRLVPGVVAIPGRGRGLVFARAARLPAYNASVGVFGLEVPDVLMSGHHEQVRRLAEEDGDSADARAPARAAGRGGAGDEERALLDEIRKEQRRTMTAMELVESRR